MASIECNVESGLLVEVNGRLLGGDYSTAICARPLPRRFDMENMSNIKTMKVIRVYSNDFWKYYYRGLTIRGKCGNPRCEVNGETVNYRNGVLVNSMWLHTVAIFRLSLLSDHTECLLNFTENFGTPFSGELSAGAYSGLLGVPLAGSLCRAPNLISSCFCCQTATASPISQFGACVFFLSAYFSCVSSMPMI